MGMQGEGHSQLIEKVGLGIGVDARF